MLPLLKFYFHEEVRKAAAQIMPDIMKAANEAKAAGLKDAAYLKALSDRIVTDMTKALDEEPEAEVQAQLLESIADFVGEAKDYMDQNQVRGAG